MKCYLKHFCYTWFPRIGGGILTSNQPAAAFSLLNLVLAGITNFLFKTGRHGSDVCY